MVIISHRGYWIEAFEKNTEKAFERSLYSNFGIETDIRDFNGDIVISHDPANEGVMTLEDFFKIYLRFPNQPILALNIKADGLQLKLKSILKKFNIYNYFIFDTAVPDAIIYINSGFLVWTRQSEYEKIPSFYNLAQGVWLDEFKEHWITDQIIENHLNADKRICIVSPELHQRSFNLEWAHYKVLEKKIGRDRLLLCTDYPLEADKYFNGKD